MKKAIVTGTGGFVGDAVAQLLLDKGFKVISLDRSSPQIEDTNFEHHHMELSNVPDVSLEKLRGADLFYHFAWQGVSGKERANTAIQLSNAQWTIDCLRLAKQVGCSRFITAGSIMEREALAAAFEPGNKPGMGYIYGSGKLVAHTMCMSVAADIDIDIIWGTITNAYGEGDASQRFIADTIRKIITGEKLQFTKGTQNFDFVHISDVAGAFYLLGERGIPFNEYIIGSGAARPLREFILEIKSCLAPDREFAFGDVPFTGVSLPLSAFDCTKTEADTGFKASVSFSDGIKRTMDWMKK